MDSDVRGRSTNKKLGLSLWRKVRSLPHEKNLKG